MVSTARTICLLQLLGGRRKDVVAIRKGTLECGQVVTLEVTGTGRPCLRLVVTIRDQALQRIVHRAANDNNLLAIDIHRVWDGVVLMFVPADHGW
jgi:hypothetical protein